MMKYVIFFTIVLCILLAETLTLRHYGINASFLDKLDTLKYATAMVGYFILAMINYLIVTLIAKKILE